VNDHRAIVSQDRRKIIAYAFAVLGITIASLAGYFGYVLYPRFDLPVVTVTGLFVLAAGAGVASFFSPCSFPLLLALFGRSPAQERSGHRPTWRQTLPFALALSAGATVFLLIIGSVIAITGARIFEGVIFVSTEGIILRSGVGAILIVLGLTQLGLIRIPLPPVQDLSDSLVESIRHQKHATGLGRVSLFGFGYLVAGFG
jgi:cytochrome c biogenesis protein CcdA